MFKKLFRFIIRNNTHVLPLVLGLALVIYFFRDLFYPEPKIFFTPELTGRSDILHFFYPVKNFLSNSLKNGGLPLWNKYAAGGFPILAEGQVGTFNFTNLVLFRLFPTWLAFDISYLVIFLTNLLGCYFLFNRNGLSKPASMLSGVAYSFGGYFIGHTAHFSLIQAMSYMPWLILASQHLWEHFDKKYLFAFVFLLSQQIFSGHPQSVFITFIALFTFFIASEYTNTPNKALRRLLVFIAAVAIGLLLSAVQLLPTAELYNQSIRKEIKVNKPMLFSYGYTTLTSLVDPFYNGKLKDGSFDENKINQTGFPGETTAYLGLVPLLFAIVGLLKYKNRSLGIPFLLLSLFSLILFLGKSTPFSFLYYLPPISSFRVPERYLVLIQFSLAYFFGVGLDFILKKFPDRKNNRLSTTFLSLLMLLTIFDLQDFSSNFNVKIDVSRVNTPPDSLKLVPEESKAIVEKSKYDLWNNYLLKYGWRNIEDFNYFKNALDENINLLYSLGNYKFYTPLSTQRQNLTVLNINQNTANAFSVDYVTSPRDLSDNQNLELVGVVNPPSTDLPKFYVYKNLGSVDRFRFVSNYYVLPLSKAMGEFMMSDQFDPATQVILEKPLGRTFEKSANTEIKILNDEHTKTILETETDKDSVLVVSDSYYPGWVAKIDGKKAKIHPANINQRAIVVPEGKHVIQFSYRSWSFYVGASISFATILGLIIYLKYGGRVFKRLKK